MNIQKTLILLKPDAVTRKIAGEIISRFERKDFTIVDMKLMNLTDEILAKHYVEHVSKPFFPELAAYMKSAPVVAIILEGHEVVAAIRQLSGATNPEQALPGTIRGDYANNIRCNIMHSSDSVESAEREISIFFGE